MKRAVTYIFALLLLNSLTASATNDISIKSDINSVTVFFKGAQVFRSGKFSAKAGTSKLIFEDVSPLINPKSIQAKSKGAFDILDVKHELKYPNPMERTPQAVPQKVKRAIVLLKDSLMHQTFMLDEIVAQLNNLNREKDMLYNSRIATGGQSSDSLELLMRFGNYYRERLAEIENRISSLRWRQHLMAKTKSGMETRLAELKNYHLKEQKPQAPLRVKHQVIITIDAKAYVNGSIEINYLVANAGWIPAYDLRAFNNDNPMQLDYKASIYQDTGEDWENVKLTLSTFRFDINGNIPSLRPHHVGFLASQVTSTVTGTNGNTTAYTPNSYSDGLIDFNVGICNGATTNLTTLQAAPTYSWDSSAGAYNVAYTDASEFFSYNYTISLPELKMRSVETYMPKPVPEYNVATESFINVEFKIDRKYTIKSDAVETMLGVHEEKIDAKYSHYLVPKKDRNAFLVTSIEDWEQLNLLKANANIYYDNNYVGETGVDPAIISDTMLLSLGRDRSIYCVRKKVKDEEKGNALGKTKERVITIEIVVKNNKNTDVDLHVKDQIPITNEPEIEIALLNASKADFDEATGALTWNVKLKPRQTKTLKFTYAITYDKSRKLAI